MSLPTPPGASRTPARAVRPRPGRRPLPPRARGLLAVAVLVLLVLVAWQRPNPFAEPFTVQVAFREGAGLKVGGEVRVAGTTAGEVTRVRHEGDRVVATLELHDDVGPLRRDASAALWPRLIFEGNAYVELRPGSLDAPPLGDGAIGADRTTSYVPLDRVLRLADAPTRRSVRRVARGLAGAADRPTSRAASRVVRRAPRVLGDVARTTHAAGGGDLRRAVAGMARTGEAVAARQADLVPALRDAVATAGAARDRDGRALRATLGALPATLSELRTGASRTDATLATLHGVATELRPGLRRVAPTVAAARPVLRRAGRVAVDTGPAAASLRGALDRAGAVTPAARGLVADAAPTLARLDESLLPALSRPTPTLRLPSYVAFLNMFAGGGGASRAFQPPSADPGQGGDGHFMRFGMRFLTGLGVPAPPCGDVRTLNAPLERLLSSLELCTP